MPKAILRDATVAGGAFMSVSRILLRIEKIKMRERERESKIFANMLR